MSLRRIRRLLALPPAAIWRRVKQRVGRFARRVMAHLPSPFLDRLTFRWALATDLPDERALVRRLKTGPYPAFFIDDQNKAWIAQEFRALCPGEEVGVLRAADQARRHVFDLLGSGLCLLGERIDWQLDFKSGHRWNEKAYFLDLRSAPYPGGYDIKVPWELSRCQHFAWLGQAYWLSGDDAYASEFRSQVEQWISANSLNRGANWVCAMDVAIRAVNWLWGYAYFRHSPSLPDAFHVLFYRSLQAHARHILQNLEYSETLTSNHYLSDIVGLVYLGLLLPEFREAAAWRDFGLRELEAEMFKQVYPDGVDFEASTNYHRLVTELFLSATMLAQRNGFNFSSAYLARLEKMVAVIGLTARPDGTTPVIGDQDNGRLHRLKVWDQPDREWIDFRPLLAAGCVWLQKPAHWHFGAADWAEAFWLAGPTAVRQFQEQQRQASPARTRSVLLPDGGWAVLGDHDDYLMIDIGSVGQNGQGGHSHNDALSVEVFAGGQAWIVDPGTYVYTTDYAARHRFRLTQAHNTVYVSGSEQSQIKAQMPFRVEVPAHTHLIRWHTELDYTLLVAEVQYACSPAITHRRAVLYAAAARAWLIADRITPEKTPAHIHFNLAPGVRAAEATQPFANLHLSAEAERSFWVCSLSGGRPAVSPSWTSMAYGQNQANLQAEFPFVGDPLHLCALLVDHSGQSLEQKIQALQQIWIQSNGAAWLMDGDIPTYPLGRPGGVA